MQTQSILFASAARILRASDDAAQSGNPAPVETIATPAPVASKPARKPSKQSGKQSAAKLASKPAKPVAAAKPDERAKLTDADRLLARKLYNGSSLPVHSRKPLPFAEYAARVANPIQRANSESLRDASFLACVISRADKLGAFDPCAGSGLDAGCVSRASSLGYLAVAGDKLKLTATGLTRARAILRKAA